MAVEVPGHVARCMAVWVSTRMAVGVADRLVHHEPRDAHRVDADDYRRADLDGELDIDLVALPEVLKLRRLALGQADVNRRPSPGDDAHRIGLEAKPAPDVGDRDERAGCEVSEEARGTRPLVGAHGLLDASLRRWCPCRRRLSALAHDAAQDEQDVRRPLGQAAHEIRIPLRAERDVDPNPEAIGDESALEVAANTVDLARAWSTASGNRKRAGPRCADCAR